MGFEEEGRDFWSGRGGPSHSKGELLRICMQHGGVLTGWENGVEAPYYGVHAHAEELAREGFIVKHEEQPLENATVWRLSDKYRRERSSS